jgi:Flp pilus assembly protein TadG
MLKQRFRLGRKASVAVEFALVASFFLVPLFGGSADMVTYIASKAQLNTALQALYYYALTYNPGTGSTLPDPTAIISSTNLNAVVSLMSSSLHPLTLSNDSVTYDCITTTATTVTYVPTSPANATGATTNGTLTYGVNNGCTPSQTQRTTVSFTVSSKVYLVVPLPFVSGNTLAITSSGTVQIK